MKCPFCNCIETKVLESRTQNEGLNIRRRRKCQQCERRFTTHEHIEFDMPLVVKNDGRREPFNKEKLRGGIAKACQKRAISTDQFEAMISGIERTILENNEKEVTTAKMGEVVMHYLHLLDPVAYVRFASVYRNFQDVDEFVSDLKHGESKFKIKRNDNIYVRE